MIIEYKRFDVQKNELVPYVITNVEKIQAHVRNLFYWKVGAPKWMYRLDLIDCKDVRIYDNETKNNFRAG